MTIGIITAMNIKDGVVLINKPLNMSSHDVVNVLRKHYHTKKVGHAGTLDVEATGLLVLGINDGTKLLNELQGHEKTYYFEVLFNTKTNTLDHTGNVTETTSVILPEWLDLSSFMGSYMQVPPSFSAVKVDGKKLYEYARKNQSIPEVPARKISIKAFKQLSPIKDNKASFTVTASSGLFVRKLALDLALSYNSVAHTTRIHRTCVGLFTIEEAVSLDQLESASILSMTQALNHLKSHELTDQEAYDVSFGRALNLSYQDELIQCVKNDELYALYQKKNERFVAKRVFKGV